MDEHGNVKGVILGTVMGLLFLAIIVTMILVVAQGLHLE